MKVLSCYFGDFEKSLSANPRLVFLKESPKNKKTEPKSEPKTKQPKGGKNNHPSVARFKEVKKAYLAAKAETKAEDAEKRLEKNHDFKTALEQYPLQADFDENMTEEQKIEKVKTSMIRAEVRKKVSQTLYEQDKNLSAPQQQEIKERQANAYYEYEIKDKSIRGFVEAPHGIAPSEKIKEWCKANGVASHETHTAEITKQVPNWLVFKRPRILADVNSLPKNSDVESSLRSEGSVYTKQDNLNALAAQRDVTQKILKEQNNLDENGQAKNPQLGIYLHGKVDTRGNDFEIAAKEVDGKNLINPLVAFWIETKIKKKIEKKGMKNSKGETPTVNVVTFPGAYSGSDALRALRNGHGTLDFKGLGENFQALQLEVSAHIRKEHQKELAEIMQELLKEFSDEFKTSDDVKKLEKDYQSVYEEKLTKEKEDFFSKEYVKFGDTEIAEDHIGLSKAVLEVLKINIGDKVNVGGHELEVIELNPAVAKLGKRILINKEYEQSVGEKIQIEVSAQTNTGTHATDEPTADHAHDAHADEKSKEEAASQWKKITSGLKYFWGAARDKVKSWFGFGGGH